MGLPGTIDWIIFFLKQFQLDEEKIRESYLSWQAAHPDFDTTDHFLCELLRQAALYNIKYANSEKEYVANNIAILKLQLEHSSHLSREQKSYLAQQLRFNNLQHSRLTS